MSLKPLLLSVMEEKRLSSHHHFENCSGCNSGKVNIDLEEGGVAMVATQRLWRYSSLELELEKFVELALRELSSLLVWDTISYLSRALIAKDTVLFNTLILRNLEYTHCITQWPMDKVTIRYLLHLWVSKYFCLKREMLTQQRFDKISGFEKWHRRLGHVSICEIQLSIKHTTGLEELLNKTFKQHTKLAVCIRALSKMIPHWKSGQANHLNK